MRSLCFTLLLLLCGTLCRGQQDTAPAAATAVSSSDAATAVDSLSDSAAKDGTTNTTAADKPRIPTQEQILSQMPPVLPVRSGLPSVDAFYLMFPALSSLLRWGSLFPAQTLLGAMPDNLQASPSKVVLVLADEANGHKSRVTRQDSSPTPPAAPAGPLNGPAMLQQMQQMLGQMPPPNLAQMMPQMPAGWLPDGFSLGQMPPMPESLNLGQMPDAFNLGQMAPAFQNLGLRPFEGLLGQAPVATTTTAAPPAEKPAAPAPSAVPTLGQAPPPGFGSFFDGSSNLLGSALGGIPGAPTPDAFMAGLRQWLPGSQGQASDISEVRVKPENPDTISYRPPQQSQAEIAQMKIKSALQMEQDKQRVPLLWFRMPSKADGTDAKPTDRTQIESKLQAFERQVIEELHQLQQIERLAREMRANAQNDPSKPGAAYKLRYPLSRTPVHKITKADIERALRDDYVRRLLQREAQRKTYAKRQVMAGEEQLTKEDILKVMAYAYRMASENADRKAKERQWQQQSAMMRQQSDGQQKAMMAQQRQWSEEQAKAMKEAQSMEDQQKAMMAQQRQWSEEQAKAMKEAQSMEDQQKAMMAQQRQWSEEQAKAMQQQATPMMNQRPDAQSMEQRQWSADQQKPMMAQQRQWSADQQKPMMAQQRQWSEEQAKAMKEAQSMEDQQKSMMAQQRQWSEEQAKAMKEAQFMEDQQKSMMAQQRQWSEEQAKAMKEAQSMEDQQKSMMAQQRQWSEEQAKAMKEAQFMEDQQKSMMAQQRQWSEEQTKAMQQQATPMINQRPEAQSMEQRQWGAEQQKSMMAQQRQWSEAVAKAQQEMQMRQWADGQSNAQSPAVLMMQMQNPMMMQQRQWADEQAKQATPMMTPQQNAMMMRQWAQAQQMPSAEQAAERQWAEEKMRAMQQQQQQQQRMGEPMDQQQMEDGMLGEAKPQMPENAGQARHKVDILGLGGDHRKKSKGKAAPTIINYYHNVPASSYAPAYRPPAPRPSYGTSYGGGGYGSNAYGGYRAAVGNDEIDSMLRQHQVMATIKPNYDPAGETQDEQRPTINITSTNTNDNNNNTDSTSSSPPPTPSNSEHRIEKRLANYFSESSPALGAGRCRCGSSHCRCGSSCRCANLTPSQSCSCGHAARLQRRRHRRSTEYGTLETIDEGSLNALRKEYKLGLKEITLSPDEDPAEALMRYNAASVREALERASQEPLEISGDQIAAGEVATEEEYATELPYETTTAATPAATATAKPMANPMAVTTSVPEAMQQDAANDERRQMLAELAEARMEFKKLYSLIEGLKEQLTKAEQGLRDCRKMEHAIATSTSTSTSSSISSSTPSSTTTTSSSSTTTTSTTSTTTQKPTDTDNWTKLLASKGYDTKYLSKAHHEQYAQGEHLDISKPENNISGDYSYQELQPYDADNKSKRATPVSTERSAAMEQAQLLNAALHSNAIPDSETDAAAAAAGGGGDTSTTTAAPYALRGKFVRRRSTRVGMRTTRQAKVTKARSPYGGEELSLLHARSTKLDQLIDVLNEILRLQLQRENALAKLTNSRATISSPSQSRSNIGSTRRPSKAPKRLRRRRKQRRPSTSSTPHTSTAV